GDYDGAVCRQSSPSGDNLVLVGGLATQPSGEFDGYDLRPEGLREGAVDDVLKPLLEAIEYPHGTSSSGVAVRGRTVRHASVRTLTRWSRQSTIWAHQHPILTR